MAVELNGLRARRERRCEPALPRPREGVHATTRGAALAWAGVFVLGVFVYVGCKTSERAPGTTPSQTPPSPLANAADDVAASPRSYDPLAKARALGKNVVNPEAVVVPQCYASTEGGANPCWTCHTTVRFPNAMDDADLQAQYAFSDFAMTNRWANLFRDRSREVAAVSDEDILQWIREDNYQPLRAALETAEDYSGFRPDLDLAAGFDDDGFARDGSGWRAYRYKPFPGAFWPMNGSAGDAMIRLPVAFRRDSQARESELIHRINFALVEAAVASDPELPRAEVRWPTEPLDETAVGLDLDGDGELGVARFLSGLPAHYVGGAAEVELERGLYPEGVEFLHSVRYLDPDAPGWLAPRMKELRYARKAEHKDRWAILSAYASEAEEKDEGALPKFAGTATSGLLNAFGWQLQAFIEAENGRLRLQTYEEHLFCMGCHSNVGVSVDQTFSFPRKVPGAAGWGHQDLAGIPDAPQLGHARGEIATYFDRVGGANDVRGNAEAQARLFEGNAPRADAMARAAVGGDGDFRDLVLPSRERALALDKAYRLLVFEQSFTLGRDPTITPSPRMLAKIPENELSTGLAEAERVFTDAQVRLDWTRWAGFAADAS